MFPIFSLANRKHPSIFLSIGRRRRCARPPTERNHPVNIDNLTIGDAIRLRFAGQRVTLSYPIPERQAITLGRGEYAEVTQ